MTRAPGQDTEPTGEPPTATGDAQATVRGFRAFRALRDRIRSRPALYPIYRAAIGVIGGLVLIAGIVMIPYPGPGWLVVFTGLAILSTEYAWAGRVLRYAKRRYDQWYAWVSRQHATVRAAVWLFTALIVVATLWLLDVYGMVGGWFGLEWNWLSSPIL